MIHRIIIHKSLVDSFKRKALKTFPYEHIVAIMGKIVKNELQVYALDAIDVTTSKIGHIVYDQPEEEIEAGTKLKYFGTLHSHPNTGADPSNHDKKAFFDTFNHCDFESEGAACECLHDEVMGIMSVNKRKNVVQYSLMFYDIDMKPVEVNISENRKRK